LICECCDAACKELVEVKNDGFRVLNRKGNIFYIKPGHENLNVEKIIHKEDKFFVVEKPGKQIDEQVSAEGANVSLEQLNKVQTSKDFEEYYQNLIGNLA